MTVTIGRRGWDDPQGAALREAQQQEICERYGRDDSEPGGPPSGADIAAFLVASNAGVPVGCGALRSLTERSGEIKRMYVVPGSRGSGVAVAVLRALESHARGLGWQELRLETGDRQPDAIRFYEREGYRRIGNFGVYADSDISICYARELTAGGSPARENR